MHGAPFAPWVLRGETIIALARRRPAGGLPAPIRPVPGPTVVTASRFEQSPVGPYCQLSVAVPARLEHRLGLCVVLQVVDRIDARTGHRLNWGFPAEVGVLAWEVDGTRWSLRWEDGGVAVSGRGRGPRVPGLMPEVTIQHRGDAPMIVPDAMAGRFRPAMVTVTAEQGPLRRLAGRHAGSLVAGVDRKVDEARTPVGVLAPLRAPARAAEPLLAETSPPARRAMPARLPTGSGEEAPR